MDVNLLEVSELIIKKIDNLDEVEKKVIINYVWSYHIIGAITSKSTENSIIKEIEGIEKNQQMKVIVHVYLTYIKPIMEQVDISDAYCKEDVSLALKDM